MRSWWWNAGGMSGDLIILSIEFESREGMPCDIQATVREAGLPGLVRAAPEVVTSFKARGEGKEYYYDDYVYPRLPFFTGRNYYGPYHRMIVTDCTLSYEVYGGLPKYDAEKDKPGALSYLIVSLIQSPRLRVKHWKVTVSYLEDGGNYPPKYLAEGDHEALIEYLELDKPEQQVTAVASQDSEN